MGSAFTGNLPNAVWQCWRSGITGLAYQSRHAKIVILDEPFGDRILIEVPKVGIVLGQIKRWTDATKAPGTLLYQKHLAVEGSKEGREELHNVSTGEARQPSDFPTPD